MPEKSQGPRSLVGYSPWGCKESDTTEQLDFFTSFAHILAVFTAQLKYTKLSEGMHLPVLKI